MSDNPTQAAREAAERIANRHGLAKRISHLARDDIVRDIEAQLLAFRQAALEEVAKEALNRVAPRSHSDYGMGAQDMANEIYEAIRRLASPAPKEE